jgi:cupin fold WbuC family metalloprotein
MHADYHDPCQRLFNAVGVSSYIRPHRHLTDPKHETLIALRGSFMVLRFDDCGRVCGSVLLSLSRVEETGCIAVELEPGEWHTVLAAEEGSVLLEVKAGPFDPGAPKDLARWAPEEGSPEAERYLDTLRQFAFGPLTS